MSIPILRFKDKDGNISSVPAIKGDKGDSGVYVGSGDMPEGYNIQIDPSGSPDISALPTVSNDDNGKIMQVVNGKWSMSKMTLADDAKTEIVNAVLAALPNGDEVSY